MNQTDYSLGQQDLTISRRSFIIACSALTLGLSGCTSLLKNTRYTSYFMIDPSPNQYVPILRAVIKAVLPFEHPKFPAITVEELEHQFLTYFPLEGDDKIKAIPQGLLIFNDLSLYAHPLAPLIAQEEFLFDDLDPIQEVEQKELIEGKLQEDQKSYKEFSNSLSSLAADFTDLPLDESRNYLKLWATSSFGIKRRFYRSLKTLIMISAYSRKELWQSIGYDGPLLMER